MSRPIAMLCIGLLFGGLTGFLIAAGYGVTLDGHDHDHNVAGAETGEHAHNHDEALQLPDDGTAPTIEVLVHADPDGGWNIQAVTSQFRFAPENVSTDHIDGEGHAHVYLNGAKIARLYSEWMQLPAVESGDVVSVGLYSNDHRVLSVGLKAINASVTIP